MLTNECAMDFALKHYNDIYAFCCSRLKNIDDAKDVTQEVFLLFQEKLQTLDSSNVRSWLFSVAERKIQCEYRSRMKRASIISLDDDDKMQKETYEPNFDFDDFCYVDNNIVEAAGAKILQRLTPDERTLFWQIYEMKKKYSDIAVESNVSENTVNIRSYRLRSKIKTIMEISFMLLVFSIVKLK